MAVMKRSTGGVLLPSIVSDEIWANTRPESGVMQAAQRRPVSGFGETVQIITGHPTAAWVAEGAAKPVSQSAMTSKTVTPYKAAVISVYTEEFRDDLPRLYQQLVQDLPKSLGALFDQTVLFGPAPGSGFDTLAGVDAVDVAPGGDPGDMYRNLVGAARAVAAGAPGARISHWLMSTTGQYDLMGETDGFGRPFFNDAAGANDGVVGRLLGAPVVQADTAYANPGSGADTVGFAGDFANYAYWGTVEGIRIKISDTASVVDGGTTHNLWQENKIAVLAEARFVFALRDEGAFVRLTGATTA